jgi:hypothetical protein
MQLAVKNPYEEFQSFYEKLIETVTTTLSNKEVFCAREEFFDLSGRVTEMDQSLEYRYSWFTEYLVFEYLIDGKSPAIRLIESYNRFSEFERVIFKELLDFKKGLFLVKANRGEEVSIKDILSEKTLSAFIPSVGVILQRSSLLQGNIFRFRDKYFISPVVLVHPEFVSKLIVQTIKKKIKGDETRFREFFWMLARLKLKQERFPRVPPVEIYRQVLENESTWIFKTT